MLVGNALQQTLVGFKLYSAVKSEGVRSERARRKEGRNNDSPAAASVELSVGLFGASQPDEDAKMFD